METNKMETLLFPKSVTFELLNQYDEFIKKYSKMTWEDVQNIWILPGETPIDNIHEIKYSYNISLSRKMILRFHNSHHSPSFFFSGLDPCNQKKLLNHFGSLKTSEICFGEPHENIFHIFSQCENFDREYLNIANFFLWIKSSTGKYEIIKLSRTMSSNAKDFYDMLINYDDPEVLYDTWCHCNEIEFFLKLSDQGKQYFIDMYQKMINKFQKSHGF